MWRQLLILASIKALGASPAKATTAAAAAAPSAAEDLAAAGSVESVRVAEGEAEAEDPAASVPESAPPAT